ncbi:MAG TPA: globin domain-containing protein [Phycisphaerae bacterium]|nr:globin domain-containing protein [Phycisphaerae bacterium]
MDPAVVERLEKSFATLATQGEELAARFYAHLFATHPGMRRFFPIDMAEEKRKLLEALVAVVKSLRSPEGLRSAVAELGQRCGHCGAMPERFPMFRDALVGIMADVAGQRWDDQFTRDWVVLLDTLSAMMGDRHRSRTTGTCPAPGWSAFQLQRRHRVNAPSVIRARS